MTHDEIFAASPVKPGMVLVLNYPEEFETLDDYSAHRGQKVMVLRPTTAAEADILWDKIDASDDEQVIDCMFVVCADDGWEGHAWESELVTGDMPWPVRR